MSEASEQVALFQWANYMTTRYPELKLLYHVPNGGKRDSKEASSLKRQGVKAGVPDIVFPIARNGYFGLYIELKVGRNKTSLKQKEWIKDLKEQNYYVEVCYGWLEARAVIEDYLNQPNTKSKGNM